MKPGRDLKRYLEEGRRHMNHAPQFDLTTDELFELIRMSKNDTVDAVTLAFYVGVDSGYRSKTIKTYQKPKKI